MDYDWTDSSYDIYRIDLNGMEEKCYRAAIQDPDCPSIYEYNLGDKYPDYCKDVRNHLKQYADLYDLSESSINRIFEKHFMFRS